MEKWDIYDKEGKQIEGELIRGEEIPNGSYHLVAEILVVHKDGSILVMQRGHKKELFPGKYEASAGGSVLKGENSEDGALRELREETGIDGNVEFMYQWSDADFQTIYDQYICITDIEKDAIVFQTDETIAYKWLKPEDFFVFMETDDFVGLQSDRILKNKDQFLKYVIDV